jgi:Tfp pilus assembly protein PilF
VALLERSRGEREAGEYAAATASLERALRIDPNNASWWIELAEVKVADGDRSQAQEMARKALTLAGNDRSIAERARRLL